MILGNSNTEKPDNSGTEEISNSKQKL